MVRKATLPIERWSIMTMLEDGARAIAATIDRRRFVRVTATSIAAGVAGAVVGQPRAALAGSVGSCCGPSKLCSDIGHSSCCSGWNCVTGNCPKCYTCYGNNCWCCVDPGQCDTTCCCDCRHGANCNYGNYCICARTIPAC